MSPGIGSLTARTTFKRNLGAVRWLHYPHGLTYLPVAFAPPVGATGDPVKTNTLRISTPLFLALALGLGACDDSSQFEDVDPPVEATERSLEDATVPTEIYYTATRDNRKCAAPMCGGFFLRAVNRSTTTCADGTVVSSDKGCYVSDIDLQGMELTDGALVHGDFQKREYEGFGTWDTLVADSIHRPIFDIEHESFFRYNRVRDTGIVCFTTPCPSQEVAKLNTPYAWNDPFSFGYMNYFGGDIVEGSETFYQLYDEHGVIVDSFWLPPWFTGNGWELSIVNVFVRQTPDVAGCLTVRDAFDDTIIAWNVDSKAQADALIGDPAQWAWTEFYEGACSTQAAVTLCTADYAPLCGTIDAVGQELTYTNECVLTQAVRTAAGEDAKAKVSPTKGACEEPVACNLDDEAYEYVGNSPEQCQVIKFGCAEGSEYFADECGCGCFTPTEPAAGEPGSTCGGFANEQCLAGLECVGLGEGGSTIGTCGCPEFINCFPGPDSVGCVSNIQELCPDSEIAF